jgi:hypothetical protein
MQQFIIVSWFQLADDEGFTRFTFEVHFLNLIIVKVQSSRYISVNFHYCKTS